MIKFVVFDFDGTLVDSKKVFITAWNKLAEENSFKKIKENEIEAMQKLSIRERSKMLDFPMYKLPFIMSHFYKLYKESLHEVMLFDGIKELLDKLEQKGYQIAIISSNSEEIIHEFLSRNDITTVSEVLCSSRIFGKDRLLRRFMTEKNIDASQVMYVGDEHRDIIACKKTRIPIIWVSWGYDAFEVIEGARPEYMVYSPTEILQIV
ncbi:HAD hydrolase-like protein [Robertmurraya andreesenii]|uniref:Phosphoglycolate phosphatase n=1 Tax=Anoxybacillus andreesenii TaxID=1325932 RepID=A0ABT9V1H3_9BACL|nr:HAD hydrolase-like protein [Robertmurraya andreesenii]MDQ0154784.1 phosphoglycolate phosphatase [Robertmurraya andreesenii]